MYIFTKKNGMALTKKISHFGKGLEGKPIDSIGINKAEMKEVREFVLNNKYKAIPWAIKERNLYLRGVQINNKENKKNNINAVKFGL